MIMSNVAPIASRPQIDGYGIPKDKKGLLPWSHVTSRMKEAMHYWVCTASPEGQPHSTPVDGLWIDDLLYFGGSPTTKRNRNLARNPSVCVHLESGSDVIILEGEARELQNPDGVLAKLLSEESSRKYGYGLTPEDYEKTAGIYVFTPRKVLAWKQFPKDATRWMLKGNA